MLFFKNILKKQPQNQLPERQYTLAKGFRGFKRFPINIHGDELSEKNNELLKDKEMPGYTIIFKPGSSANYKNPFYLVYIENLKIGAIFDPNQVQEIQKGLFSAVYARSEEESTISGKKIIKRHNMKLFVKYEGKS